MKNCNKKTVIQLGRSYPSYCGCGCNPCKCNSSSGGSGSGINLPSGGNDGDALIKNGDGLIWGDLQPADYVFDEDIIVNLAGGKTLGKYINGQTINSTGKTILQVFQDIATEVILGTFTSFSITGQNNTVEIGTTLIGSKTFNWNFTLNDSIITGINIVDVTASNILLANTPNDGTQATNITNKTLTTNGETQQFRLVAHDSESDTDINSNTITITSRFLRFWGATVASVSNSATVRALTNNAFYTGSSSFTLATGTTLTKFTIALPPGITITSVIDSSALNVDITDEYILTGTINVLDAGGVNRSYNIYEMNISVPYSTNHNHLITTI